MKLNHRRALAILILITLLGFALRLHNLTGVPLRGDEAFSVQYWARLPLSQSLTTIATIEPHPLLTYLTFRGWGLLAGTGEFSMRLLPALTNLLGVPALYALGKRLGGRRAGVVTALLWALHPMEIWHAQDARNYGIWAGTSAVALWLGYRAVQRDRRIDWILYAGAATIATNIFYNEVFTMAAFSLFVLITRWGNWRLIRRTLAAQTVAALTAGLSFVGLQWSLLTGGGYGGTAGNFDLAELPKFLTTLTFGKDLPLTLTAITWSFILLTVLIGLFLLWRRNRETAIFLGLLAFVPLVILSVLSLRLKIFAPHYIFSTVPAYILIFSTIIANFSGAFAVRNVAEGLKPSPAIVPPANTLRSRILHWGGVAVAVIWLIGAGYTLNNYYNDPAYIKASNWPRVTRYLADYVKPDDLVIQLAIDPAFGYYYDAPALDIALPSFPAQTADDIVAGLTEYTADRQSVWLVGQPYPDWPNRDVVQTWMREQFQPVLDTQAAGLHIQQFMPWEVRDDEVNTKPLATFGDVAELVGWEVIFPPEIDGNLTLRLYWRSIGQSDTPLKVFAHLEGAPNPATGSPLWTQDDQYPQDGRVDTSNWTRGEVYRDVYTLPLGGVLPGAYQARVGLYNPESNQRVMTESGDSFLIQSINLPFTGVK